MTTWYTGNSQSMSLNWTTTDLAFDSILYRIKEYLKLGAATNGWDLHYSSNGVVAGSDGDGVDRWTDETSIADQAWVVFRSAAGIEICIQKGTKYVGGWGLDRFKFGFIMSPSAGFTGGTATNRPTATDTTDICEHNTAYSLNTRYAELAGTFGQSAIHISSTDGKNLIIGIFRLGTCVGLFGVLELEQIRASETNYNYVIFKAGVNTEADVYDGSGEWNYMPHKECMYPSVFSHNDRNSNARKYFKARMRDYDASAAHEMVFLEPNFGIALNTGNYCTKFSHAHSGIGGICEFDILVGTYRDENTPEDKVLRGKLVGLRRIGPIPTGVVFENIDEEIRLSIGQYSIPWTAGLALSV